MHETTLRLVREKLISGHRVQQIFDELYQDIFDLDIGSPSGFMTQTWGRYTPTSQVLNGKIFESLLAVLFYRLGIQPLYVEAKLAFVPNVEFDFIAYSQDFGPLILSAKTSLRERYKQADLEGMMVRQVHRRAKSYLITLNENEARTVNKKIAAGQVLGLDEVLVARETRFDEVVHTLARHVYCAPGAVEVVTAQRVCG